MENVWNCCEPPNTQNKQTTSIGSEKRPGRAVDTVETPTSIFINLYHKQRTQSS